MISDLASKVQVHHGHEWLVILELLFSNSKPGLSLAAIMQAACFSFWGLQKLELSSARDYRQCMSFEH